MAVLDQFLKEISRFLRTKDAIGLKSYLKVEPPLPAIYGQLTEELKRTFRDGEKLEQHISKLIPENDDPKPDEGTAWSAFHALIKEYLEFWRDVNFDDLLTTHVQLSALVSTCVNAMYHTTYGIIILPTTIQLSEAVAKLAMTLDKRPDLTRGLRQMAADSGDNRKTLVEGTAETIQRAFTMCFSDRGQNRNGIGRDGKPEGKKIGIYSFANLVLKLLVQCRKTRLANQLFTNVSQHSPPLALYPASQRVTYLYYLGRFMFANNHFYWSQLALQSAYDQCHAQCLSQRRLILTYLISANTILGKFPSAALLSRPEATGLLEKFNPIWESIRRGDIIGTKRALGPEGGNERWFFQKGLLLPLLSRCEVLVWRSLARRVFLLTYITPTDANSRAAATLDINDLVTAAQYCQKILEGWQRPVDSTKMQSAVRQHTNAIFLQKFLPDLKPPAQPLKLMANQGVVFGNKEPEITDIEAIVTSLIQQGFLHGFVSHKLQRFAILGAKQRGGALKAGFPEPWRVIHERAQANGHYSMPIPGWVREERVMGRLGGVVNLSGIARPVGSGA